jgi:hypothetical protein
MRLLLRALAIAVATAALAAAVVTPSPAAHSSSAKVQSVPRWLKAAETLTLDRVFGGARPVHITYISYPQKIAAVFGSTMSSSAALAARRATRAFRVGA